MGGIDLDPFSCSAAQKRIAARIHYTKAQNGLLKPWKGRCWFQPPYTLEIIEQAAEKLLMSLAGVDAAHDVTDCVGLTNQSEAHWWHALARKATAICQTEGRINFDQPDGKGGTRETKNNRFAQTFFYFGSRLDRFEERFEKRGTIFTPRLRRSMEAT
jgi:ParB family chromosome partitioning protein